MEEEKKEMTVDGVKLYVQKMEPDAKVPAKQNATDSGFDVYSYRFLKLYQNFGSNGERLMEKELLNNQVYDDGIELKYLDRVLVGTGLKVTAAPNYEIQVRPRSGMALKQGLTVLNTPGTIDEAYRGELGVIIVNLSRANQVIKLDTRIAQIVVAPVVLPEIEVVPSLPKSDRGGGFGHTGSK